MTNKRGDWCILRTSGGRTLPLARSLAKAGFDVWTPMRKVRRRVPRSNARREIEAPITPTFVFARAFQLPELARVLALPVTPHPGFSIFRHAGRIPLIADREIASLRVEEEREADRARRENGKSHRRVFPVGGQVRLPQGAFAGLTGVVESGDGKAAVVSFGGSLRMTIEAWLLEPDEVSGAQPTGIAA